MTKKNPKQTSEQRKQQSPLEGLAFRPEPTDEIELKWLFAGAGARRVLSPKQLERKKRVQRALNGFGFRLRRYYVHGQEFAEPLLAVYVDDDDLDENARVIAAAFSREFSAPEFDRLQWLNKVAARLRDGYIASTAEKARQHTWEEGALVWTMLRAGALLNDEYTRYRENSRAIRANWRCELESYTEVGRDNLRDALRAAKHRVDFEPSFEEETPEVAAVSFVSSPSGSYAHATELPQPDVRGESALRFANESLEEYFRAGAITYSLCGALRIPPDFARSLSSMLTMFGPVDATSVEELTDDEILQRFKRVVESFGDRRRIAVKNPVDRGRAARKKTWLHDALGIDARVEQRNLERRELNMEPLQEGKEPPPDGRDTTVSELARKLQLATTDVRAILLKYGCTEAAKKRARIPLGFLQTDQGKSFWRAAERVSLVKAGALGRGVR